MRTTIYKSRLKSPCYGCTRRTAECHATCPEYGDYTAAKAQENAEFARLKNLDADIIQIEKARYGRDRQRTERRPT